MTKKDQLQAELKEKVKEGIKPSHLKKSKSLESLPSQSPKSPETNQVKELKTQIAALLEQITRIKKEANQSLQSKEQEIKELTTEKNELFDHNNELRINNLQQTDYFTKYQTESKLTQQLKLQLAKRQKDLTISQQDLKSAQRIIELRTIKPVNSNKDTQAFDYWDWIRIGSLILLIYLLSQDKDN